MGVGGGGYGCGKMDDGRVECPDCKVRHRTTLGRTSPANGGHRSRGEGEGGAEESAAWAGNTTTLGDEGWHSEMTKKKQGSL